MGEGKRRQQAQDAPANGATPMAYVKATPYWLVFTTGQFKRSVAATAAHLEALARVPSAHNAHLPAGFAQPEFAQAGAPPICVADREGKILFGGDMGMQAYIAECARRELLQTYVDCLPGFLRFEGEQEILWIEEGTGLLIDSKGDRITDPVGHLKGKVRYATGGKAEAYFLADAPAYVQATLRDPMEGELGCGIIPSFNALHATAFALTCQGHPSEATRHSLAIIDQQATLSLGLAPKA